LLIAVLLREFVCECYEATISSSPPLGGLEYHAVEVHEFMARIIEGMFENLNRRLRAMNNATVIAVVRGVPGGVLCVMVGALLGCASADPESGSNELSG
jgi:hypothetical protein